jgi:acetyl-CoA C-acetyltransferase
MHEVAIIEAVRTPVGRRNGALAMTHANDLLGSVLTALLDRTGLAGEQIGEVFGGCVGQYGMQASNVTRNAWLAAGLPVDVPATTVNVNCGSSQEAVTVAYGQIRGGLTDVAIACGVEVMSTVGLGVTVPPGGPAGLPREGSYARRYEATTQLEAADRIAEQWDIDRETIDRFGVRSQDLAARGWELGYFDQQIVPVGTVMRDEGPRPTALEVIGTLKTNQPARFPPSRHTAATSSQISDGASGVLLASMEAAQRLGLRPRARIVDSILVGSDPVLMLTGPIPATSKILGRSGKTLADIDLFEINEAFAAVVLAWAKEFDADLDRVNVNGGAIALGHPLGATGGILLAKLLYELERRDQHLGLVSMCCGGGLGTATLIERLR